MFRIATTAALVLIFAFWMPGQTSSAPDFSGVWVLDIGKSTLAKDDTIKSETIAVSYKKSTIIFQYKTDGKKSTERYVPNGKPRAEHVASGELVSKAGWQDSALVIESTLQIKIPNVTVAVSGLKPVVDRWTLAPDGRTLSHEAPSSKEVFVYDKQ